ncbi:MAG: MCE family protein [Planctomycetes bacterium]|nr:MCE family protein [Planctomycetota bacterium]
MHRRGRRFRLGLYVLGTGALFVGLLAFILQNSLNGERAAYFILFRENVKGMVVGSKVNFQGVPIGVVKDMRFQDGKTLVELRVDPSRANIQDITQARMDRLLVTGQVTVELEGYGASGRSLAPGSFIQPKDDPMHSLTASVPEVVDRAAAVLDRIDRVLQGAEQLLGPANQAHLAAILDDCHRLTTALADETAPAATAALRDASASVRALAALTPELTAMLRETTSLAAGLRGPAQAALTNFRTALEDVRGLARQLKLAPDSLLFGVRQAAAPMGGDR